MLCSAARNSLLLSSPHALKKYLPPPQPKAACVLSNACRVRERSRLRADAQRESSCPLPPSSSLPPPVHRQPLPPRPPMLAPAAPAPRPSPPPRAGPQSTPPRRQRSSAAAATASRRLRPARCSRPCARRGESFVFFRHSSCKEEKRWRRAGALSPPTECLLPPSFATRRRVSCDLMRDHTRGAEESKRRRAKKERSLRGKHAVSLFRRLRPLSLVSPFLFQPSSHLPTHPP